MFDKKIWRFRHPKSSTNEHCIINEMVVEVQGSHLQNLVEIHYYSGHPMKHSNFWSEIVKLKQLDHCSISYTPESDPDLKFWIDNWPIGTNIMT